MTDLTKYPCPCCGHCVFDRQPGFSETCPICGWEDCLDQLRFPTITGAANAVCLVAAQANYEACGAAERRNAGVFRKPVDGEPLDEGWRPIDLERDNIEVPMSGQNYAEDYPYADTTVLYYWRPSYWRRVVG